MRVPRHARTVRDRWPGVIVEGVLFASLVVTFRFLEEINKLPSADPWLARLRDAYLEPWGHGLADTFALAIRVGAFAHVMAWARQRDALREGGREPFDTGFRIVLRRGIAQILD